MSPSKILFFLCISFIAGIFLESVIRIPLIFVLGFLLLGFLFIFIYIFLIKCPVGHFISWKIYGAVAGFCLLFLVMGVLRVQISEFSIANDKLSKFNGKGQVVMTGIISNEPDVRGAYQKIKVKIEESTVLVTTSRYPEYKYLDKIKLTGKLETPMVSEDFNYKNYLMKDHIYSVMGFPKISARGGPASGGEFMFWEKVYSGILFFKQKIRESIQHNFLPPQSSILEGTILGDNGAMTDDLKAKLNATGLRHIIAVSGTHVVILSAIIMYLLLSVGFRRGQAFYIALLFIIFYIVLTGLPPSGVRAGVMGGLYLLAQKLGRQTMGPRVIVIACAVMLLINPLLLFYDVGFQLSFLAVMGLIYLEPLIKKGIKTFSKDKAENLVEIVSTTFAAQIFTLPIMIYNFGNISFVAPITNLLVLPIVSPLMILGFLVSIVGIFSNVLGWILSIPCWFLLTYFVKVIDYFSQPWAMKTLQNVHWIWPVVLYLIIISGTRFLNNKYGQKFV